MYKTILVPLDGSDVAPSMLAHVGTLARGYDARVLLLTVGPSLPAAIPRAQDIQLTLTFQAEAYLERIRVTLEAQGLEVATTVCIGDPACEILEVAERHAADLIVITSQGGARGPSPFLGSVAAKVAGASTVPVLVLHPPARGHDAT